MGPGQGVISHRRSSRKGKFQRCKSVQVVPESDQTDQRSRAWQSSPATVLVARGRHPHDPEIWMIVSVACKTHALLLLSLV